MSRGLEEKPDEVIVTLHFDSNDKAAEERERLLIRIRDDADKAGLTQMDVNSKFFQKW